MFPVERAAMDSRMKSISYTLIALSVLLAADPAVATEDVRQLFDRGQLRRAATACEQRLAANPADAAAGEVLSRIRGEQKDLEGALRLATTAAAADPKSANAQYALAEAYGRLAREAGMLKAAGLAGKMRKAADAALALDPKHVDALEILVDFHRMAPGIMGGDKKKAAGFLERIVQANPAVGWIKRGQTALQDKDTTLAARCFANALERDPASGRARVQLAFWLAPRWRDPARAEKLALQAVEAEPWRTGGWQVLAALYAFQQRWAELESALQRSEAAEPTHLAPWFQAGRQLVSDHKEAARAEGYLRRYLSREPEIGAPSVAAARWRLGQALEQQGRKAEATSEIAQAVKLDPKLEDAKKDLKRLRG